MGCHATKPKKKNINNVAKYQDPILNNVVNQQHSNAPILPQIQPIEQMKPIEPIKSIELEEINYLQNCQPPQQQNSQQNQIPQPIQVQQVLYSNQIILQEKQPLQIMSNGENQNENGICFNCKVQDQGLISLDCKHLYHKKCLIEIFKLKNSCQCGRQVVSIKKFLGLQLEDIIMKNRLQVIFKKYSAEKQFYYCTNCPFFFVYNNDLNKSLSMEHYCPICLKMLPYDEKLCQMIDLNQLKTMDSTASLPYSQILQKCYSCNKRLYQNDYKALRCQHSYHFQCLKDQIQNSFQYKCICKKKISDKNLKLQKKELEQFKNSFFEHQLSKIIYQTNEKIDFCKGGCGFFWIRDEESQNQQNSIYHCYECGYEEFKQLCFECNKQIYRQSITFYICGHLHHISCALKKIQSNGDILSCKCNTKLDSVDLEQLGVVCMICENKDKSSDKLFKFKCQHYIHKKCFEINYFQFLNLQCCGESLLDILEDPELKKVKIVINNNKNDKFCYYCRKGIQDGLLLGFVCPEEQKPQFIHKICLEMLLNTTYYNNGSTECQCKSLISEDLILKLF